MYLKTERYQAQLQHWPKNGSHILAQFDSEAVVVYQAYKPSIAEFAAKHGYFGGEFSLSRMSWIKTNFLWMMYRSAWGTSSNQESVLAIWLKRRAFEQILSEAVHSTYKPEHYVSKECWSTNLRHSNVRLQWDPDHGPYGNRQERRAIQLGMKGATLNSYASDWILRIEDITPFVTKQRKHVERKALAELVTPSELAYPIFPPELAQRIGISALEKDSMNG